MFVHSTDATTHSEQEIGTNKSTFRRIKHDGAETRASIPESCTVGEAKHVGSSKVAYEPTIAADEDANKELRTTRREVWTKDGR